MSKQLIACLLLVACVGCVTPEADTIIIPTERPVTSTLQPSPTTLVDPTATQQPSPTPTLTPEPDTARLVIGGDVIEYRYEFPLEDYPGLERGLAGIIPLMRTADLVMFNAEGGLCDPYELDLARRAEYSFYLTPDSLINLHGHFPEATFILGQANNHTMNFSDECRRHGATTLTASNRHIIGSGDNLAQARQPYIGEYGATNIAILAYSATQIIPEHFIAFPSQPGIMPADPTLLIEDLQKIPDDVFTIVVMHAAYEYTYTPHDSEIQFAKAAVEHGADLIVGHGPHVIQNPVIIDGVPVFYSLGNALMDLCFSDPVRSSYWLEVILQEGALQDIIIHPYYAETCMEPESVG